MSLPKSIFLLAILSKTYGVKQQFFAGKTAAGQWTSSRTNTDMHIFHATTYSFNLILLLIYCWHCNWTEFAHVLCVLCHHHLHSIVTHWCTVHKEYTKWNIWINDTGVGIEFWSTIYDLINIHNFIFLFLSLQTSLLLHRESRSTYKFKKKLYQYDEKCMQSTAFFGAGAICV